MPSADTSQSGCAPSDSTASPSSHKEWWSRRTDRAWVPASHRAGKPGPRGLPTWNCYTSKTSTSAMCEASHIRACFCYSNSIRMQAGWGLCPSGAFWLQSSLRTGERSLRRGPELPRACHRGAWLRLQDTGQNSSPPGNWGNTCALSELKGGPRRPRLVKALEKAQSRQRREGQKPGFSSAFQTQVC